MTKTLIKLRPWESNTQPKLYKTEQLKYGDIPRLNSLLITLLDKLTLIN